MIPGESKAAGAKGVGRDWEAIGSEPAPGAVAS